MDEPYTAGAIAGVACAQLDFAWALVSAEFSRRRVAKYLAATGQWTPEVFEAYMEGHRDAYTTTMEDLERRYPTSTP